MRLPWPHPQCVLCARDRPLTDEHIIPRAIGGKFSVRFLCKDCNSTAGAKVEADVKKDPSIRCAIDAIRALAPEFVSKLEDGQEFYGETDLGKISGILRKERFRTQPRKENDGSLALPTDEGRRYISKN